MSALNTVPLTAPGTNGDTLVKVLAGGERYLSLAGLKTALVPHVDVLSQTVTAASFTDGGGATGTRNMTGTVPAGAILLAAKVLVTAGFGSSATLQIGDAGDVDRWMTGTPSISATAATGVEVGVPSGAKLVTAAQTVLLTITAGADFTPVLSGGGVMTVSLYYIRTV